MRRSEKEVTNRDEIIDIIERGEICRIGFCDEGVPYIVPMNYGYSDGRLYFHSAKTGRKIELLQKNNRVCFEIEVDTKIVRKEHACSWQMKYRSVMGYGKLLVVDDPSKTRTGLSVIMNHYLKKEDWSFADESVDKVVVLQLEIDEMTGKQSI